MLDTIRTLQDSGVQPDIWKVEGLDSPDDCERVVELARRDGRDDSDCRRTIGEQALERGAALELGPEARIFGYVLGSRGTGPEQGSQPFRPGFFDGCVPWWRRVADCEAVPKGGPLE